jgi:hypothetical protein
MRHYAVIAKFKEFVQAPVDVIITWVAELSTVITVPANNEVKVAVDGVTVPTFAVKLKLGPKSAPNPEFNVNVTFIFYNL